MSDNVRHTIVRFAVVFVGIAVMFGVVLWRIAYIQTVEHDKWEKVAEKQVKTNVVVPATRGNIYDDNERLLATSVPQYIVKMDTRVEALHLGGDTLFYKYVDSMAVGLSQILGDKTPQEYKAKMVRAFRGKTTKERYIRIYPERISYTQKKAIQQLPLIRRGYYKSGFEFDDQHRRVKPFGSLMSRTIGNIYGEDGRGNAGLEKRFDEQLRGKDGISTRQKAGTKWQLVPVIEAERGQDIYTTLDTDLSDICESELRQRLAITSADWGCVILMATQTGEIKAICNLDRDEEGRYYERMNHAVTRVEPGSTFKTIALMAALDDGHIDIDDTVRVWKKGWSYYGSRHTDSHPRDTIYTVQSALAVSSNIALAQLIVQAYHGSAKKFIKKLTHMGLKDSIDYTIPGADQIRLDIPNDTVTISKMAYGYSVEMSPMQSVTFYNAIANNGTMVSPVLVKGVGQYGNITKEYSTRVIKNNICSHGTLKDIQACLHDVVWDNKLGTASVLPWGTKKAQSDMVHIAGKTGTAQILEKGRYQKGRHRMSFVGYFPEEDPQYTCMCIIHGPRNSGAYDAGMDCGTTVRRIAERIIAFRGEYVIENDSLVFHMKQNP